MNLNFQFDAAEHEVFRNVFNVKWCRADLRRLWECNKDTTRVNWGNRVRQLQRSCRPHEKTWWVADGRELKQLTN